MARPDTHLRWLAPSDRPLDRDGAPGAPFEPFGDDALDQPIGRRFLAVAARYPTRIAIDDGGSRLTYAETADRVAGLAARVAAVVPPGRPVAIALPNAALFPIAALACLTAGRPYVPVDLDYPAARNVEILREAGAAAAIVLPHDNAAEALLPARLPQLDASSTGVPANAPPCPAVDVDAPAVILYTSGSTGRPKGICNAQHALLRCAAFLTDGGHVDAEDRVILLSSPSGIAGVRDTLVALLNGASLRIADLRRLGIGSVQQIMREARITVYISVPAVLRQVLSGAGGREAARALRLVRLGGDTVFATDIALASAVLPRPSQILVGYGLTEATILCQWLVRPGVIESGRVACGYPVPGVQFALVVPVAGDHWSMLDPVHGEGLAAAFVETARAAMAVAPREDRLPSCSLAEIPHNDPPIG